MPSASTRAPAALARAKSERPARSRAFTKRKPVGAGKLLGEVEDAVVAWLESGGKGRPGREAHGRHGARREAAARPPASTPRDGADGRPPTAAAARPAWRHRGRGSAAAAPGATLLLRLFEVSDDGVGHLIEGCGCRRDPPSACRDRPAQRAPRAPRRGRRGPRPGGGASRRRRGSRPPGWRAACRRCRARCRGRLRRRRNRRPRCCPARRRGRPPARRTDPR